jgi:hypothetical protein
MIYISFFMPVNINYEGWLEIPWIAPNVEQTLGIAKPLSNLMELWVNPDSLQNS